MVLLLFNITDSDKINYENVGKNICQFCFCFLYNDAVIPKKSNSKHMFENTPQNPVIIPRYLGAENMKYLSAKKNYLKYNT